MLKEIFVMDNGILTFHYSREKESSDSDQAILSSGLLSALRDFSQQARANTLESFYSENEFFLFSGLRKSESIIACVFERGAPQRVAAETMNRIRELIDSVDMPTVSGLQLDDDAKADVREKVRQIVVELFGEEDAEAHMHQVIGERNDIPLAFVVDVTQRRVIAKYARPRPLYREEHVQEFLLVHDTLLRVLAKLGGHEEYRYFTLGTEDYSIASCWSGRMVSVTTGSMRASEEVVLDVAGRLCHQSAVVTSPIEENRVTGRSRMSKDGDVVHEAGVVLPPLTGIFLSTLANNLDSFIRLIARRSFDRFQVGFPGNGGSILALHRDRGGSIEVILLRA